MAGRTRASLGPARVVPLRPHRHRGDPARRARGHLRHPRLRREAAPPPLRRPAVPRSERLALPARGLQGALRHGRHPRNALRPQAARAEDSRHHRRHELRRALGAGQGGAGTRRERGRHLDDDRRRRDDRRGARALDDPRLPGPALALRHEPGRPAQGRRDRDRRRTGCEAGRRRHAPRPQDLRPGRGDARPARRASTSGAPAATPTGRARTTWRSRSASCARSPTGRSRSS